VAKSLLAYLLTDYVLGSVGQSQSDSIHCACEGVEC